MPIALTAATEAERTVTEEGDLAAAVTEEALVTEELMAVLAPEFTEAMDAISVQQIPNLT